MRADARDVVLEVCGTAFDGYEWYVEELEERAARPDLEGTVTFAGYVVDLWGALERSHIVVAPSLGESLGNAVIEAQLASRPVVASDVQGHTETVSDDETGVLVPAGDPDALATAIGQLLDEPEPSITARRGRAPDGDAPVLSRPLRRGDGQRARGVVRSERSPSRRELIDQRLRTADVRRARRAEHDGPDVGQRPHPLDGLPGGMAPEASTDMATARNGRCSSASR